MDQPNEQQKMTIPPTLTLQVNEAAFNLIRQELGKLPYDTIGPLCQNLEVQVQQQVFAFNGRGPDGLPLPQVPETDVSSMVGLQKAVQLAATVRRTRRKPAAKG